MGAKALPGNAQQNTVLISEASANQSARQLSWYDQSSAITISTTLRTAPVVGVARQMLADDLALVTGKKPQIYTSFNNKATICAIDLSRDKSQDKWLKSLGLPVDSLRRLKDGFLVKALAEGNGSKGRIIVAGADARGTAYGLLEVSRMAGVTPWVWWGDAKPQHRNSLTIASDYCTVQSPSVEYRGVFINDEDWSFQPWSWLNFDRQKQGVISANTYRELFKLLLRLRANMIWPAMHESTVAFYQVPGAKECADSCGIVIGTSHCEPLMRNNAGEWEVAKRGRYNYITNRESVIGYWTERLKEAGQNENFYTIGMRGVHDGEMEGVKTQQEKVDALNAVIKDQRELLTKYLVNDKKVRKARGYKRVEDIPQVFVPYKEVLQTMEAGVNVPDDVTLMWCDDNYGYMTRLSDSLQQKRKGGAGVYYHLSYWGRPHDYLWLTTTAPGLIYSEMKQAYDHNARKTWIANVHDPKVACYDLELFLDLAWNINTVSCPVRRNYGSDAVTVSLDQHLRNWLCRQYGEAAGTALLPVMKEFYRLTTIRRPEHMGWNQTELDKKTYPRGISPVRDTEFSFTEFGNEAQRYIDDYAAIRHEAERIGREMISKEMQEAYFAQVLYPVSGASYMAEKLLYAQQARQLASGGVGRLRWERDEKLTLACAKSQYAYQQIRSLTDHYNNTIAGGKWKNLMCDNPRDLYVFWAPTLPVSLTDAEMKTALANDKTRKATAVPSSTKDYYALNASRYTSLAGKTSSEGSAKGAADASAERRPTIIENLGHSQQAVALPKGMALNYRFTAEKSGEANVTLCLIPTQANDKGDIRVEVSIDGAAPKVFSLKEPFRSETWKLNVLRGQARFVMPVEIKEGEHTLTVKALDDHIILDQWMLDFNKNRKYYVIPTGR